MSNNLSNLYNIFLAGLPLWILCAGGLVCLTVESLWPKRATLLVYTLAIASLVGSLLTIFRYWQNPASIAQSDFLIFDMLTLYVMGLVTLVGILTLFNALGYIRLHQNLASELSALVLFSIAGMILMFASDNLLVSFVGLETMSLCIYVLVGSHKKNYKSSEAAIKYFIAGGVASAILLYGIALFYGSFETLQLSVLANLLPTPELEFMRRMALTLMLTGVLFKLAIVPFHFWAPDVYEGAPAPITGFMATGVKIAVFAFAIRLFMAFNVLQFPEMPGLLTTLTVLTLVVGNTAAIMQNDVKRMLAYSSIAHAGFLLLGILAAFRDQSFVAFQSHVVLFYLLGYLLMTLGAFAVISLLTREKSEATSFDDLKGMAVKHPILAALFTLFMLAMVGMPGTIGFAAKYNIIAMAVQNHHIPLAIVAVITSVISAYYYLRPSVMMYFHESNGDEVIAYQPLTITVVLTVCTFLVIYVGLFPDQFITLSQIAATALK